MFTDKTVLSAVSCLNQWCSCCFFGFFLITVQISCTQSSHQEEQPHEPCAPEIWNTPTLISDTGLRPASGSEATWQGNHSCIQAVYWEWPLEADFQNLYYEHCLMLCKLAHSKNSTWYQQLDTTVRQTKPFSKYTLALLNLLEIQSL